MVQKGVEHAEERSYREPNHHHAASHGDDLASRIIDDGAAVLEIPMEFRDQMRAWPRTKGVDGGGTS